MGDVLGPYKATIERWLWPDVYKNLDYSVAKAKKPISYFKKAIGQQADSPGCLPKSGVLQETGKALFGADS